MLEKIQSLININIDYFGNFSPLTVILRELEVDLIKCWNQCEAVRVIAKQYNFSDEVEGNGYNSFVKIFMRAVEKIEADLARVTAKRRCWWFSARSCEKYMKCLMVDNS